MKIIVENSTWRNLGDGFYQSALYVLIKKLFPTHHIFMGEGPVERSFQPNAKQKVNAFRMMDCQRADIHIFSGPILRQLTTNYKNAIININQRGEKYALVSCSSAGITNDLYKTTADFLNKYPPIAFSTRDENSYQLFKDVVPSAYNGICTSFLVNELLPIDTLDIGEKYLISSFYQSPEPEFQLNGNDCILENIVVKHRKRMLSLPWTYSRHLEIFRKVPEYLGDKKILRLIQGVSNKSNYYNFAYPNSYISINPITFLAAFKGTEFTISDRVHACAVTLAFGKPARLIGFNNRCGIFDRMGIDYKSTNGLMSLEQSKIREEIQLLSDYLIKNIK